MPKIASVDAFLEHLAAGSLSWSTVSRYVEIDPESPVMRVRMRPGVLPGPLPDPVVVDELVYEMDQRQQADQRARRRKGRGKQSIIVADGDSWFHLPPIIRPEAIADRIGEESLFDMHNLAHWGDTLKRRIAEKKYLHALANCKANWLILSGGGNDVQVSLAKHEFLFQYDANRPLQQAITPEGGHLLQEITAGYSTIFNEVRSAFPHIPIVCYAYDYPRPTAKHTEYIGKHLRALGYPLATWSPLVRVILDQLSSAVMSAAAAFPGVAYLDCFGVAQSYPWFDDMHPDTEGFKALAKWFEARMSRATHALSLKRRAAAASAHGRRRVQPKRRK